MPAISDFAAGLRQLLADDGVLTVEFPHLLRLISEVQFDTIYHEHFFYLSLAAVERVFAKHGLKLFDVEQLPTHGGSLRIFAERADSKTARASSENLQAVRDLERDAATVRISPNLWKDIAPRRAEFAEAMRETGEHSRVALSTPPRPALIGGSDLPQIYWWLGHALLRTHDFLRARRQATLDQEKREQEDGNAAQASMNLK